MSSETEHRAAPWWSTERIAAWRVTWDASTMQEVAPRLFAPERVVIVIEDWRGYDLTVEARPGAEGFECAALTVVERDTPVDFGAVRAIPFREVMRPAALALVFGLPADDADGPGGMYLELPEDGPEAGPHPLLAAMLETSRDLRMFAVAAAHALASYGGLPPKETAIALLNRSASSVTRDVTAARAAGLFENGPEPYPRPIANPSDFFEQNRGGVQVVAKRFDGMD